MFFQFINTVNLIIYFECIVLGHILSSIFPKRNHYVLRLIGSSLVGGALAYFLPVFYSPSIFVSWVYAVFMYVFLLLEALLCLYFTVKAKFINYLYCAVSAYALHHLASNVEGILSGAFPILALTAEYSIWGILTQLGCLLLAVGFCILLLRHNNGMRVTMNRKRVVYLATFIVLLDIGISSFLMLAGFRGLNLIANLTSDIYATVASLLSIFVIFNLLEKQQLEREVEIINGLYKENMRQYEVSKATMASLHDLKHKLNAVMKGRLALSHEERKEIRDGIFIFDAQSKTGNETLDIILTEKKMLCAQYGIEFNTMVDGSKLDFMDEYDIFSLFGNAISNAIEAVERQEKGRPKYISLIIKGTERYVSIHLENAYDGEIHMEDGVPSTDKDDKNAHGFGVKSMYNIANKYDGNMTIHFRDGIFNLDILFNR